MSSSIPAALDYLFTSIKALPELAGVAVSDGWPTEPNSQVVAIGVVPEGEDAEIEISYAQLSREENEDVQLPCLVSVRTSGDGAASRARVAAFAIYDAINQLVRSDRRFGGAVVTGLPARISEYRMSQTSTAKEAGDGRQCRIRFVIAWQHRG